MKSKWPYLLWGVVAVTLVNPGTVLATRAPRVANAEVLGQITNCSENLPYVSVVATCGGQTLSGGTGSTNGDTGKYSLTFNNASCQNGATVNVTANVNGTPYSSSGVVSPYFIWGNKAFVDINTGSNCSVPGVPEFGMIPGVIAAITSAGGFWALRRKTV